MKQIILFAFAITLFCSTSHAQQSRSKYNYGIKGGLNICDLVNGSSIGARTKLGYSATLLADKSVNKPFGMREEFTYSKEGFKYRNARSSGNVDYYYLYLTHLFAFNLGNIVQIHAGPQVGFLFNAMADSIRNVTSANVGRFFSVAGQTSRINLGGCAGVEFYPWKGLIVGARYNLGFIAVNKNKDSSNIYSGLSSDSKSVSSLKTRVWQIHVGWRVFSRD